ncbi:MAG: ABC transporter permease [Conexibacter sp.]
MSVTADTALLPGAGEEPALEPGPGLLREAARRYARNRLAMVGLVLGAIIALMALLAPVIAPYGRDAASFTAILQHPSAAHLLGTDQVGRDFFTRLIYGARTSVLVGISVPLLSMLIGVPLGALAGWYGGWIEFVFLRFVEVIQSIPFVIVPILLVTLSKNPPGLLTLIVYIAAVSWLTTARLTRAQFLTLKQREFVHSARAVGASDRRIMLQHILPNAAGPIVVGVMNIIPLAIFAEATLSFLGLGVQDPIPSWGKMVADGASYIQAYPLLVLAPAAMIALTILAFTFIGDGVRDALDPHSDR